MTRLEERPEGWDPILPPPHGDTNPALAQDGTADVPPARRHALAGRRKSVEVRRVGPGVILSGLAAILTFWWLVAHG
jgi:hypothetical protein